MKILPRTDFENETSLEEVIRNLDAASKSAILVATKLEKIINGDFKRINRKYNP